MSKKDTKFIRLYYLKWLPYYGKEMPQELIFISCNYNEEVLIKALEEEGKFDPEELRLLQCSSSRSEAWTEKLPGIGTMEGYMGNGQWWYETDLKPFDEVTIFPDCSVEVKRKKRN